MSRKVSICFVVVLAVAASTMPNPPDNTGRIGNRDGVKGISATSPSVNQTDGKGRQAQNSPVSKDQVLGNINQQPATDRVNGKANQEPVSRVPANQVVSKNSQGQKSPLPANKVLGNINEQRPQAADKVVGNNNQERVLRDDAGRVVGKINQDSNARGGEERVAGKTNQAQKTLVSADEVIGQVTQSQKSTVRGARGKVIQISSSRVPAGREAGQASQVDSKRG